MVNLNFILHNNGYIQNLYKYWQSRGSLLSDTVITKIPAVSTRRYSSYSLSSLLCPDDVDVEYDE